MPAARTTNPGKNAGCRGGPAWSEPKCRPNDKGKNNVSQRVVSDLSGKSAASPTTAAKQEDQDIGADLYISKLNDPLQKKYHPKFEASARGRDAATTAQEKSRYQKKVEKYYDKMYSAGLRSLGSFDITTRVVDTQ